MHLCAKPRCNTPATWAGQSPIAHRVGQAPALVQQLPPMNSTLNQEFYHGHLYLIENPEDYEYSTRRICLVRRYDLLCIAAMHPGPGRWFQRKCRRVIVIRTLYGFSGYFDSARRLVLPKQTLIRGRSGGCGVDGHILVNPSLLPVAAPALFDDAPLAERA